MMRVKALTLAFAALMVGTTAAAIAPGASDSKLTTRVDLECPGQVTMSCPDHITPICAGTCCVCTCDATGQLVWYGCFG